MALLMACSVFLASCSDEKTDDQIRQENVCKADTAYTLSVWMPTNASSAEINDPASDFNKRLSAVEEAINDRLSTNSTKIKIVAVNDAEYEAKLNEKINSAISSKLPKPSTLGDKYVNSAYPYTPPNADPEDYFYKLQYPEILENQIDICLIRDYATYSSFVAKNALHSLNDYVTSSTASYPRFLKMIRQEFINPLIIDKNLYGIPNNRAYVADEYQYILINKKLAESAELTINVEGIKSLVDCEKIINKIGELNLDGIVPLVGTEKDLSGVWSWGDEQSLIVSTNDKTAPDSIINNEQYMLYTSLYKALSEKNYVKDSLSDGEVAGVFVYTGTKAGAEAYSDDYYLVRSENPVMTEEQAYGSMFAISEYSIKYDRAMSFLYMLHTDEEIRTLVQYGIKDTDYVLDYSVDEDNPTIKLIKDENGNVVYDMNNNYTGNGYITYREDGAVIDDWNYIKSVNYDAVISKYLHFQSNYNKASATVKAEVDAITEALRAFNAEIFADIKAMSYAEFEEFKAAYESAKGINYKDLLDKLEKGQAEYDLLKPEEQNKKDLIESNKAWIEENKNDESLSEEISAKEKENTDLQAELDKISAYDELLAKKATYTANNVAFKILESDALSQALEKYTALNKTYNK